MLGHVSLPGSRAFHFLKKWGRGGIEKNSYLAVEVDQLYKEM
jgi:hypothetical protein